MNPVTLPLSPCVVSIWNIISFESTFKRKMVMSLLTWHSSSLLAHLFITVERVARYQGHVSPPEGFLVVTYFHVCHLWLARWWQLFLCIQTSIKIKCKNKIQMEVLKTIYFIDTRRTWIGDWNQIKRSSEVHF